MVLPLLCVFFVCLDLMGPGHDLKRLECEFCHVGFVSLGFVHTPTPTT